MSASRSPGAQSPGQLGVRAPLCTRLAAVLDSLACWHARLLKPGFLPTRFPGRPMLKAAFKSVLRGLGYEVHRRVSEQASGLVEVAYGPYTIEMYPGKAQPGPTPDTYVWNDVPKGALGRLVTLAYGKYPDLAVIDVGSNVGDTAAVIKAGADVPVFCIEGDPQIYPILQRNTRRLPGPRRCKHCGIGISIKVRSVQGAVPYLASLGARATASAPRRRCASHISCGLRRGSQRSATGSSSRRFVRQRPEDASWRR